MRMERRFCRMNTKTKILRISVESPNNHLNFKSYLSWNRKNKSTENLPFRSNDLDRLKCDVWKRVSVFPRNSLLFNENENRFVNPMDKYGSDCVTPFIYYTMCMIEVMLFVCVCVSLLFHDPAKGVTTNNWALPADYQISLCFFSIFCEFFHHILCFYFRYYAFPSSFLICALVIKCANRMRTCEVKLHARRTNSPINIQARTPQNENHWQLQQCNIRVKN